MNLININGVARIDERDKVAVISRISLRRLIVGGAAIFAHENINHQRDRIGIVSRIPLVRATLRV